jgi:hypothetical protein
MGRKKHFMETPLDPPELTFVIHPPHKHNPDDPNEKTVHFDMEFYYNGKPLRRLFGDSRKEWVWKTPDIDYE